MPGNGPRKAKGARRSGGPRRTKPARPVLGNDPFERGAAERPAPEAPPAEVAAAPPAVEAPPSRKGSPGAGPAGPSLSALRERLEGLEARIGSAASNAEEKLGGLGREEGEAFDLLQAVSKLVPALQERLPALGALRALVAGTGDLDAFGMERDLVVRAMPLLEFLYATWWRVEAREIEEVPSEGPVVVVANHGGALPWDALVLRLALLRDHPARRELRPLLDQAALATPLVGGLALRLGAVPATPENAARLLGERRAVAVFPEGSSQALRPWPQRYRIERFGRGGFAKIALRAGATVIPCAILGSEETSAPLARPGWLSARLGMPALLAAPALPLGALGAFPLPSRWSLRFGEPLFSGGPDPEAADDSALVQDLTNRTRAALQRMLDEDLAARRNVYLG